MSRSGGDPQRRIGVESRLRRERAERRRRVRGLEEHADGHRRLAGCGDARAHAVAVGLEPERDDGRGPVEGDPADRSLVHVGLAGLGGGASGIGVPHGNPFALRPTAAAACGRPDTAASAIAVSCSQLSSRRLPSASQRTSRSGSGVGCDTAAADGLGDGAGDAALGDATGVGALSDGVVVGAHAATASTIAPMAPASLNACPSTARVGTSDRWRS